MEQNRRARSYLALQFALLLQAKVFRCICHGSEGLLGVVSVEKCVKRT